MLAAIANINDEWCPNCGEPTKKLNEYTGWCPNCSSDDPYVHVENYLARNADHIEHYIAKGFSLNQSLQLVRKDHKVSCVCCGQLMTNAPQNAVFCNRYEKCRKTRNRYQYLHKRKGIPKSQALTIVMTELAS